MTILMALCIYSGNSLKVLQRRRAICRMLWIWDILLVVSLASWLPVLKQRPEL